MAPLSRSNRSQSFGSLGNLPKGYRQNKPGPLEFPFVILAKRALVCASSSWLGLAARRSRAGCSRQLATNQNAQPLFFNTDLNAGLRCCLHNIDHGGGDRAGRAVKTGRVGAHRQVRDYERDAVDVDCSCRNYLVCPGSNTTHQTDSEWRPEFLGMASGGSL